MKFLAVTACPSGVAHTYMAAEAIEKACRERGIEVKVETQGSIGIENEITADDVKDADIVILTKDMPIKNEEKFGDLPKARIAISDAGVGITMCEAAMKGASLNVFINTKLMKDRELAEDMNFKADKMLAEAAQIEEETFGRVMDAVRP